MGQYDILGRVETTTGEADIFHFLVYTVFKKTRYKPENVRSGVIHNVMKAVLF